MTTDLQLRQRVIDELEFDPSVDAAHIGVTARDGVVTLTGHVTTFLEKLAAEQAVRRVKGVAAVAQEIEIRHPDDAKLGDDEIAARVVKILEWHMAVPAHRIAVKVDHGVVTLGGTVDWYYQKIRAEEDVRRIGGVSAVLNEIDVSLGLHAEEIRRQINAALERQAGVDPNAVSVVVAGAKVTLAGKVQSQDERIVCERIAWSPRGVSEVDNKILCPNDRK
jgi:osmotically-inducible protein OsmY